MKSNVIFIDHSRAIGGAEKVLLALFDHLKDVNVHLVCQYGELANQAGMNSVVVIHHHNLSRLRGSPGFLGSLYRGAKGIANLANELNAIAIFSNTIRSTFYGKFASILGKRPFIWHVQDFWLAESRPQYTFIDKEIKRLLSWNTHTIAVSRSVAHNMPAKEVEVVYNGIEIEQFNPQIASQPFREAYQIPLDSPLVGMVGRLRPWKGQRTFLQMAAKLTEALPDCHFVIVGGTTFGVQDDYPQQLQELADELKLMELVTFTGALADVRPALAAIDIFVHPGQPEPFGLVNVEAMAMARPVVAFRHGALPEIVADGQTGILVPPGDISALADAVIGLLRDPKKRQRMGNNGRQRAETHFTIERTAREISHLLEELIAES